MLEMPDEIVIKVLHRPSRSGGTNLLHDIRFYIATSVLSLREVLPTIRSTVDNMEYYESRGLFRLIGRTRCVPTGRFGL